MTKIILCSSKCLNLVEEYISIEDVFQKPFVIELEFGNLYVTKLIDEIIDICKSGENTFIHTYSKEVLEIFAKHISDVEFSFVRLYSRNGKLRTVDYDKEEFIENINEGWDLR